jgi:hypothetical protein
VRVGLPEQVGRVTRDADHLKTRLLKDAHDASRTSGSSSPTTTRTAMPATLPHGDIPMAAPLADGHPDDMTSPIAPETALEQELISDPRLRAGLEWGVPRLGHPEGRVGEHVAAMLAAIPSNDPLRDDLRFLALVHDSFKAEVQPGERWLRENDHATRARRFAERYTSDERLLTALELHDEPYWIWRTADASEKALRPLLKRLPDPELFARFVELDAANEGKDLTFLWWFRRELAVDGRLPGHAASVPDGTSHDVVYVKEFATSPEQQPAVAHAAEELIAEQRNRMQADGEVLTSDDGLRVVMQWHWHGSRRDLLDRDADVVREALAAHPIFADTRAVEARIFHTATGT